MPDVNLKFTDSRFLNLAWAQVNFKIYLARARPPYYRAAVQIKIDAFADSGETQTRIAAWYGARAGKLAKHTEIGARTGGLKVGKFKKYRRLAIGASKSKK